MSYIFGIALDTSTNLIYFFRKAISASLSPQLFNLWKAGIAAGIHSIWYARNQSIFEDRTISLSISLATVWSGMREANNIQKGTMKNSVEDVSILRKLGVQGLPSKAPNIIAVHWLPPPPGWIKINTNGAANGNPSFAGCGGVFRSHRGFFKGGFASPIGMAFAFEAELLAVIKAIDYALQYNWTFIWLESDSSYVVHLLNSRSTAVPWPIKTRWIRCLNQIDSISFRVSHIYREGNMVANDLSKFAVNLDSDNWWFHVPTCCHSSYSRDLSGQEGFRFM